MAAGTGVPSVSLCLSAPTVVPSAYFARATATTSDDDAYDDRDDAVALRVDHADDQRDDCGQGHDHGDRPTRLRRGERHPGASDRHDDEEELARDAQRLVGDPHHRGHDHADDQQDGDDRRQPLSAGGLDSGAHHGAHATTSRPATTDDWRVDPTVLRTIPVGGPSSTGGLTDGQGSANILANRMVEFPRGVKANRRRIDRWALACVLDSSVSAPSSGGI